MDNISTYQTKLYISIVKYLHEYTICVHPYSVPTLYNYVRQVTIHVVCWFLLFYFIGKSLYEYIERPITTTLINAPIEPSGTSRP